MVNFLGSKMTGIESTDHNGETALHCAAAVGSLRAIQALLRQGADFERRNKVCSVRLAHAVCCLHSRTAMYLSGCVGRDLSLGAFSSQQPASRLSLAPVVRGSVMPRAPLVDAST